MTQPAVKGPPHVRFAIVIYTHNFQYGSMDWNYHIKKPQGACILLDFIYQWYA